MKPTAQIKLFDALISLLTFPSIIFASIPDLPLSTPLVLNPPSRNVLCEMILQPSFHRKALRRDNWSHSTQQWPQHSKPLMSTRFQGYNNYFRIRERVNKRLSLGRLVQEVCGGTKLSVVGKQWNCRGEIVEGDERAEVTWHCRKGSQR